MDILMQFMRSNNSGWHTYALIRNDDGQLEWSWWQCSHEDGYDEPLEGIPQSPIIAFNSSNIPYEKAPL